MNTLISKILRKRAATLLTAAGVTIMVMSPIELLASTPAAVPIAQMPLTIAIPAHPQIMIAIANSESMDGNLSGAIMFGSGALGGSLAGLQASSSPVNFTIPAGFTPPLNPGNGVLAPYSVISNGNLVDNSPSRLNVAKAGVTAILNGFMASADFGLMDYQTGGSPLYQTWVYQMSPPGGFTFTSVPAPSGQVPNPCYHINVFAGDPVAQSCAAINAHYGQDITTQAYMNIGSSSDDPSINDVLYAGGQSPICIAFSGPHPPTPYPPNFTLGQFNGGGFNVHEDYNRGVNNCALSTGPTNAGFVPFSTEVMYEQRGWGWGSGQSPDDGSIPVGMQTAGATPTAASVAAKLALFAPYLQPETSNFNSGEIKAMAGQSPMAGLMRAARNYYATTNPASSNGCSPQRYVILVTDGLPTLDISGATWPPLGSAAATGYGVSATFNADGSLAATNDQAMTDVINELARLKAAHINTYIVGLGAGVDPTKNPIAAQTLTAMAVAGGTGAYFAATDPTTLTNDLQIILGSILAATQSVASVAVNSTGLSTNSVVYQSQFISSDTDQDWTGNLYAFPADPTNGTVDTLPADALWAAAQRLDLQNWSTGRKIATWDPQTGSATPFVWRNGNPPSGIANLTTLGQPLTQFQPDPNGQDVLNYLRGNKSQEVQNGGKFRNRTHILGDIVFSNPVYVGAPSSNNLSTSYLTFAGAHANRPPVLYVGANDGMLHAFDAVTGDERWAYIPKGVYGNLINLVSPFYNARHQFFVDGSPVQYDVKFADATWHTLLFGNEAQGGRSVFAIDITDPTAIASEAALSTAVRWDITDGDLGYGFATPVLANTNSGALLFVANGYDSNNEKPFLYVLNPETGATVVKLDLCNAVATACNLNVANGLSTPIVVNTSGQSTASANMVYAGDLQGNLWRIDISNSDPTTWPLSVSVILQARDTLGNPQPITTAPTATLNPRYPQLAGTMVFVGTGQLLGIPDLANTKRQSIYGVYDPPAGYTTPLTRTDLVRQDLTGATMTGPNGLPIAVATVSSNAVSIPATKGWVIDLTLNDGERVVSPPLLRSGAVIVTSTQPAVSTCSTGGLSFSYFINFATGSAFSSPQFDVNGDHKITIANDTVPGPNGTHLVPLGVSLGVGFYAGATLQNTSGTTPQTTPAGTLVYNCPASGSGVCIPRYMKGVISHRVSWWEVRQ
jgi:type IV pilus assembly protein PilY1